MKNTYNIELYRSINKLICEHNKCQDIKYFLPELLKSYRELFLFRGRDLENDFILRLRYIWHFKYIRFSRSIVKFLLKNFFDYEKDTFPHILNSLLYISIEINDINSLKAILEKGIDLNEINHFEGISALDYAKNEKNKNIIKILIKYGAKSTKEIEQENIIQNWKEMNNTCACGFSLTFAILGLLMVLLLFIVFSNINIYSGILYLLTFLSLYIMDYKSINKEEDFYFSYAKGIGYKMNFLEKYCNLWFIMKPLLLSYMICGVLLGK